MSHKEEFLSNCIVVDTETTGKNFQTAEIIESGFVIRENNDWVIFQELHKPVNTPIPPSVESICYITNKMVEDKPSFVDSKDTFQSVMDGFTDGYVIGHNYFYDMKVLQNHGISLPGDSICTWRMARKLFNGVESIEETNLPYLRFALELDIPLELRCHRAGNDSFITAKLLEVLVDLMEESNLIDKDQPYGPQIMHWAAEPIIYDRMPFGKHKGELMVDVPHSYWTWSLKNMDSLNSDADNFDPDFAASVHKALGFD
jgi:DNA polymerase III epsilon subunit-like protein